MWGISGVFTLALTVAKTSSNYDRFAIFVPARSLLLFDLAYQDGNVSGPKGWRGTRVNGGISRSQKHCYLRRKCIFDDLPLASTQLLRQKSFDNGTSMLGRSFNFDDKNSTLLWYLCSGSWYCFLRSSETSQAAKEPPHKKGLNMSPSGFVFGSQTAIHTTQFFRTAFFQYIQSGVTSTHLHLDWMMPF